MHVPFPPRVTGHQSHWTHPCWGWMYVPDRHESHNVPNVMCCLHSQPPVSWFHIAVPSLEQLSTETIQRNKALTDTIQINKILIASTITRSSRCGISVLSCYLFKNCRKTIRLSINLRTLALASAAIRIALYQTNKLADK